MRQPLLEKPIGEPCGSYHLVNAGMLALHVLVVAQRLSMSEGPVSYAVTTTLRPLPRPRLQRHPIVMPNLSPLSPV